jgi:hypothetical protein
MRQPVMKLVVGALCTLAVVAPAAAQFEPLQFSICKKLPDDAARLKCFDSIGPKAKSADEEAINPTPVIGKWVYSESKSPIDDSDQVFAILAGEPQGAMLGFRCREHKTDVLIVPAPGFFASERASALVRIGDAAPTTVLMPVSTDGRSLFPSPAQEFIKLLPDNTKLFIRATGFQGRQADLSFELADVSAAREKIANTCHWATPKADRPASASAVIPPKAKPIPYLPGQK